MQRDPDQPPAGPRPAVAGRCRSGARHRPGRQRLCSSRTSAAAACSRRCRHSCSCRRSATDRRPGRRTHGPDRYRRAVYTFRYRSLPYPVLQTFDAPNGDSACVRRARSNTPLQALTTLNEPLFVECARAWPCERLRDGGTSDAERLDLRLPPLRCPSPIGGGIGRVTVVARQADASASPPATPNRGTWPPTTRTIRRSCPPA